MVDGCISVDNGFGLLGANGCNGTRKKGKFNYSCMIEACTNYFLYALYLFWWKRFEAVQGMVILLWTCTLAWCNCMGNDEGRIHLDGHIWLGGRKYCQVLIC